MECTPTKTVRDLLHRVSLSIGGRARKWNHKRDAFSYPLFRTSSSFRETWTTKFRVSHEQCSVFLATCQQDGKFTGFDFAVTTISITPAGRKGDGASRFLSGEAKGEDA